MDVVSLLTLNKILYNSIKINYSFSPSLNKNTYKIQEHIIDQPLYYYDNKWNISTKSTIDANTKWSSNKSFEVLFKETCEILKFNYKAL